MTKPWEADSISLVVAGGCRSNEWGEIIMLFGRKKKSVPSKVTQKPVFRSEPSFIGRNTTFEGHIDCDGELHIDGTVRGTVRASLCVVDEAGIIHGSLTGDIIHVRGRVLGPIQGANVFIHAGAHVEGDVFNDTISIENGAYVYGSIRHNAAPPPAPNSLPLATSVANDGKPGELQNLRVINGRKAP